MLYFFCLYLSIVIGAWAEETEFAPVQTGITSGSRVQKSADQIFAIFYQSCSAPKKAPFDLFQHGELRGFEMEKHPFNGGMVSKIVDLRLAQESSYYLSCGTTNRPAPGCRDLCGAPPSYLWGAKGMYYKKGAAFDLDLFTNQKGIENIAKHPGLDCSGYVNAVLANAGLKAEPGKSYDYAAMNKGASFFRGPSQCFSAVVPQGDTFIKPGDLVTWQGHILIADALGTDPFGLKGIKSLDQCTNEFLKPSQFTLTLSNSVGSIKGVPPEQLMGLDVSKITGVGIGLSKWKLGSFVYGRPVETMELAKIACYAKFGKKLPFQATFVVRHVLGSVDRLPEQHPCKAGKNERVFVEGAECVANCR